MKTNRFLKHGGLIALILLVAFTCAAQASYPLPADISIVKTAEDSAHQPIAQISPGAVFYYEIEVKNNDIKNIAPDVMVTDKLPYDVIFKDIQVTPATPKDYNITRSGDLIYIRFDKIDPTVSKKIEITVQAPNEAPTTLYNIANVRYANDPDPNNNTASSNVYVPEVGYDQTVAAKSFEDLLHNQSQLLFQFEDLLHSVPDGATENYTFLASFEQLLRAQANLTGSFEDLLHNKDGSDWNSEYTQENRTYLLKSYQRMLYDEAFLFASFDMKLNDSWMSFCGKHADGHTQDMQTEFIASFEDLLKRQTTLYKSFNLLLDKLNGEHDTTVGFLDAYETLLRIETNLIMRFSHLLNTKYIETERCHAPDVFCTLPTIQVTRIEIPHTGQKFEINVTNNDDASTLTIDELKTVVGITNAPEDRSYNLDGSSSTLWDMVIPHGSNLGTATYKGAIAPIAPGGTETFYLDYLTITGTGFTIPAELSFDFNAVTSCGTVWENTTHQIFGLNTPNPKK